MKTSKNLSLIRRTQCHKNRPRLQRAVVVRQHLHLHRRQEARNRRGGERHPDRTSWIQWKAVGHCHCKVSEVMAPKHQ